MHQAWPQSHDIVAKASGAQGPATFITLFGFVALLFQVLRQLLTRNPTRTAMFTMSGDDFEQYNQSWKDWDKSQWGNEGANEKTPFGDDPYYGDDDSEEDVLDDDDAQFAWERASLAGELNSMEFQTEEEKNEFIRQQVRKKVQEANANKSKATPFSEGEGEMPFDGVTLGELPEEEFFKGSKYHVRAYGNVKSWNDYYGYGFIEPHCQGPDVFVHATEIHSDPATGYRDLAPGELVYYDIKRDDDGKAQAINVTGPNGSYVLGRRGGGITLDDDVIDPVVRPKKKGVIRDFTESSFWSTERVAETEVLGVDKVPEIPEPEVKWWEG